MGLIEEWNEILERFELNETRLVRELKVKKLDHVEEMKINYEVGMVKESIENIKKYIKRLQLIEKVREI